MKPSFSTCISIAVFTLMSAAAQAAIIPSGRSVALSGFEENKGQVLTTAGDAAPFVRYRLTQGNTSIFLLGNGIAYQFNRLHYPTGYEALEKDARQDPAQQREFDLLRKEVRLETYRMDVLLEGANADALITTEGRSTDYTQYYGQNVLDVYSYTRVTYHEVYPGIDWVVYTTSEGLEYDFVLRPGADPAKIQLRFTDYEELRVDANGQLIQGNRMGRFTEERPVSFQNGKEVDSRFVLDGNRLGFALGAYDHSRPLTIDPTRIWGTYYGEMDNDIGNSCAVDGSGNVYLAGGTASHNAIASGGHDNTLGGSGDAFLVKFNASGVRQWGTYYGGTNSEYGNSCAVDGSDNVYLAGNTRSENAIASDGHQNIFGGGSYDAFLVKFNASGVRQWGTYYGGAGSESCGTCAVDGGNNVYLAGYTDSDTAIASGGHQNAFGGYVDAFLVKFNASGVRQWGTYYGGTNFDYGHSCATDGSDNVYLAGETVSGTAIASAGHQNTYGGGIKDAFLVKFNDSGVRQWGTYYGGTNNDDGFFCAVDGSDNVYLAGRTTSGTAIALGGYQNTIGGSWDAFLVKFNPIGIRQWGTYYGGTQHDEGYSCAVDGSDNVYVAGSTLSDTAIASGGYQNTYGGGGGPLGGDAFMAKFNASGVRQWATYYGGAHNEAGRSCTADGSNNVYLAGLTLSDIAIASGGHQNSRGGNVDGFLVKFDAGTDIITVISSMQGQQPSISIWPNPNAGENFFLQAHGSGPVSVQLFDDFGQLQRTWQLHLTLGQAPVEMDLDKDLSKGLYLVRCTVGGRSSTAPLMIQ